MTTPTPDVRVTEIRDHASRILELCDEITGTAPPIPLPPPANVTASLSERTTLSVGWAVLLGAAGYHVQVDDLMVPTPGAPYVVHDLQVGLHTVKVRGYDSAGAVGMWSDPITVTVDPAPPVALPAPAGVTATVSDRSTVTVGWSPVAGAGSYAVEIDGATVGVVADGTLQLVRAGQQDGQHTVRVRAADPAGYGGDWSAPVTFTVEPAAPTLGAPSGLTGTVASDRRCTLTWQLGANAVSTELHEFLVDPANTLKATLPAPTASRVSGQLAVRPAPGLKYAVRSVGADGSRSGWSNYVQVVITETGGTVTDLGDGSGSGSGNPGGDGGTGPTPPPLTPADWYVSPSGSDSNAGTKASPLKTIPAALAKASAGQVVECAPGTYPAYTPKSGSPGRPIMVRGEQDPRMPGTQPSRIVGQIMWDKPDCGISRFDRSGGQWCNDVTADGVEIWDCTIHDVAKGGSSGQDGGSAIEVYRGDYTPTMRRIRICRNVIYSIGKGVGSNELVQGIYLSNPAEDCIVYGNVVRGVDDFGIHGYRNTRGWTIAHNNVDGCGRGLLCTGANKVYNNVVGNTGQNYDLRTTQTACAGNLAWGNGEGSGTGIRRIGDPMYVAPGSDWRPKAGSPLIDAGVAAGAIYPWDFAGNPRPSGSAPDAGAFEYVASSGGSGSSGGGTASYPADVFGSNWKLTIPIDADGSGAADEIKPPAIATYSSQWCQLSPTRDSVIFRCPHGGATTSGSSNPRSELRELINGAGAAWGTNDGRRHRMTTRLRVNRLTAVRPHVVINQIHDAGDDVSMWRVEADKLWLTDGDSPHGFLVDPAFQLGRLVEIGYDVQGGVIRYTYNGQPVSWSKAISTSGCYFKAGCYLQSNASTAPGESTSEFAEVEISSILVSHA